MILEEPTVALVPRGKLLCWQAELKVKEIILQDDSAGEHDSQSDHLTAE